jgi:hypothetical protein
MKIFKDERDGAAARQGDREPGERLEKPRYFAFGGQRRGCRQRRKAGADFGHERRQRREPDRFEIERRNERRSLTDGA